MWNQTLEDALNQQINEEMFSSLLYMSMSADFQVKSLKGAARWMEIQSREEWNHAMKLYNFILDRGGKVKLAAIKEPQHTWDTAVKAFEAAYQHEQFITKCFDKLADLAMTEKDHATLAFLQWFITEQVEEEATAQEIVEKLRMVEGNPAGIYMIDKELDARQVAAASEAAL